MSSELWSLYKTAENRTGSAPMVSTPITPSSIRTSEVESSESQNERSASISVSSKIAKVQRVTPTKRETSSSSSGFSSPVRTAPEERRVTPRAPRTPQSDASSRLPESNSSRRPRQLPLISRTQPHPTQSRSTISSTVTPTRTLPRIPSATSSRRTYTRRRLFEEPTLLEQYQRSNSEPVIEHLNVSPMKDDAWIAACPPRIHLERNRPSFINRLEARQRIIRAAAQQRAAIEQKKRDAARAVALGHKSVESVRRELFADSTSIQAFYQRDMREITMKNIRRTDDYRGRIWNRMANVDRAANRIIAQSHNAVRFIFYEFGA
ncbi:unnamed protein product [Caenorhabditis bovis]|uniref:Uncharacterized protein n=1 Tax=Caenorhabditis bovis TaxID=2654633 RepID=A0A8S1ELN8_9PELO|nr:unnamed protein product [Caenorhabditis bovis]